MANDKVEGLALRLAQGAAVVTGLLAFFGITGGQLDRLLRNQPTLTITFFALIGTGIVAGIAVLSLPASVKRRYAWGAIGTVLLVGAAALVATRIYDDHPVLAIALYVVGSAVLLAFLVLVAIQLDARGVVLMVGVVAFVVGVAGIADLAVISKAAKDRPTVEAQLSRDDEGWTVKGTVKARGLSSAEHISIAIEGLRFHQPFEDRRAGLVSNPFEAAKLQLGKIAGDDFFQTISFMRIGPDSDGEVSVPIAAPITVGLYERVRVAVRLETEATEQASHDYNDLLDKIVDARASIPPGQQTSSKYENAQKTARVYAARHPELLDTSRCSAERRERSCIEFLIPQSAVRPTLHLVPKGAKTVALDVKARKLDPDDVVDVVVSTRNRSVLYRGRLSGDADGSVDEAVEVPVPSGARIVCALARVARSPQLRAPRYRPKRLKGGCDAIFKWNLASVRIDVPAH